MIYGLSTLPEGRSPFVYVWFDVGLGILLLAMCLLLGLAIRASANDQRARRLNALIWEAEELRDPLNQVPIPDDVRNAVNDLHRRVRTLVRKRYDQDHQRRYEAPIADFSNEPDANVRHAFHVRLQRLQEFRGDAL